MTARPFEDHVATLAAEIEAGLDEALAGLGAAGCPARLLAAMRHATLGGGKRLRPALLTIVAEMLGADRRGALRAGLAVECVHGYSLVHDDLPAMDDDDLRRGRPTVHRAFDEATAILVGDALQTLAFEILGEPATHPDGAVRAELVVALARASGAAGMVGGQMLDLAAEGRFDDGRPQRLGEAEVLNLQAMKTGALIAASVDMGAILGTAGAEARAALATYGQAVGAAFQIADDLLDAEGASAAVGKATGKDAAAGKGTLVGLLGLDGARARLAALTEAAFAALAPFGDAAEPLRAAALFAAQRRR